MTPKAYERLRQCVRNKKDSDYVFTRKDGSPVVDPREDWYTLCVASKLGVYVLAKGGNGEDYLKYVGLNIHDSRRNAIRNMKRQKISDTVAMRISGHTTRPVFDRYNITDEEDLEHAAVQIAEGQASFGSAVESDTKSDTSTYAH
jgi:hypothetical protein